MFMTDARNMAWVSRRKLAAAAVVVGVVAVACGSSTTASPPQSAPATALPAVSLAPTATQAPAEPTATQAPEATAAPAEPTAAAPASSFVPVEPRPIDITEQQLVRRAQALNWMTDFERRSINLDELFISLRRDAIQPIDDPGFESAVDATERIDPKEPVIILEINDDVRAYPLSILVNHEIVNDTVGGVPVTVTFCPLCNSSIAFERTVDGSVRRFGTSGMLRKSDLVMWDMTTESLWQQLTGKAIVGSDTGRQLKFLPVQLASFDEFVTSNPDGTVLKPPRSQPYLRTSYQGYDDEGGKKPFLFFDDVDPRLPATARVVALDLGSGPVAYSFDLLAENPVLNVESGGLPIAIFFDDTTESAFRSASRDNPGKINISGSATTYLREANGQTFTFVDNGDGTFRDNETGSRWDRFGAAIDGPSAGTQLDQVIHGDHFWFAWVAFEPDTELITDISQIPGN